MRSLVHAAVLTLMGLGPLAQTADTASLFGFAAQAAPAVQRIGGTWDLTWKNRRGETRRGSMVIEQRGTQLVAHVYDRGGATATGSIAGSSFNLSGRRLALPFTVTGRVKGRKMTGMLVGLGIERRFTGVRRGR